MTEMKSESCTHITGGNTKRKRICEKIESSSRCIFTCQTCEQRVKKSPGRPPKERMRVIPDGRVHWICWTCEESFCGVEIGVEIVHGPGGHAFEHGQKDNHSCAIRVDKPNEFYCFVCNKYRLVRTEAEKSTEVESAKDAIEDPVLRKCDHYALRSTMVKQILQGIKASFSRYFICEKCNKRAPGRPSKKKKETISEPTFDWVCLDCEQNFCGGETSDGGPMGHILVHALSNDHIFCARLDKLSQVWCLKCHILLPLGKRRKPCRVKGLPNYGNTCYFNSALQNLFAMNRLRQCLANLEMPAGHVTKALKKLFSETSDDSKESIQASELLDFVQKNHRFVEGQQHDSHELLLYLLGELESEGMSFMDEIFRGEFSSTLHCDRCGNTSITHDPLCDLSLQVPFKTPPNERNEISPLESNAPTAAKNDGNKYTGIAEQSVPAKLVSKLKSDDPPPNERTEISPLKSNAPPVAKDDGNQDTGIAEQSVLAHLVSLLESDDPLPEYPEEMVVNCVRELDVLLQIVPEGNEVDVPRSAEIPYTSAEASFGHPVLNDTFVNNNEVYYHVPLLTVDPMDEFGAPVSDYTLVNVKRKIIQQRNRQQRKNKLSSKRMSSAKVIKKGSSKPDAVKKQGSSKPAIAEDVNVLNYDEVCQVEDTNGPLSIERCLALFTEPEDMPDNHCVNCSPHLQQQNPSEASEFQGDGVKSEGKKTPVYPCKTSDQLNVRCGGHNVAAPSESLPGCLGKEQLSEDVDMESKSKKVKRKITKMLLVKRAAFILIIHLKRFTQLKSGSFKKIEGHIVFEEMLDLIPYMDSRFVRDEKYLYRLIGIVEHLGTSIEHGHYVAYIRGEQIKGGQDSWFKAEDFKIEEISLEEVLARNAYILFYERT